MDLNIRVIGWHKSILPLIVLFFRLQRYFVEGVQGLSFVVKCYVGKRQVEQSIV